MKLFVLMLFLTHLQAVRPLPVDTQEVWSIDDANLVEANAMPKHCEVSYYVLNCSAHRI